MSYRGRYNQAAYDAARKEAAARVRASGKRWRAWLFWPATAVPAVTSFSLSVGAALKYPPQLEELARMQLSELLQAPVPAGADATLLGASVLATVGLLTAIAAQAMWNGSTASNVRHEDDGGSYLHPSRRVAKVLEEEGYSKPEPVEAKEYDYERARDGLAAWKLGGGVGWGAASGTALVAGVTQGIPVLNGVPLDNNLPFLGDVGVPLPLLLIGAGVATGIAAWHYLSRFRQVSKSTLQKRDNEVARKLRRNNYTLPAPAAA